MNRIQIPCPWDPARSEIAMNTPERALEILELLMEQGEKTLATMQAMEVLAKTDQWRRAAHGLAGSAMNLGLERLARCCKEDLESTATVQQRNMLLEAIRTELLRIAVYKYTLQY